MSEWYSGFAWVIFLAVAGGLLRVIRGPTRADRMLAAQLFGTAGVAIALLLAEAPGAAGLVDVALVFALLSAVATVAFVRLVWHSETREEEPVHVVD